MANQRILISLASRRMDKDATCPLVIITRPGFNRLREEFAQQRSDRGGGYPLATAIYSSFRNAVGAHPRMQWFLQGDVSTPAIGRI